jgi:outer membrane biosynthesis protein TonB
VAILEEAALPTYPPIAKAAHITGVVMVRVTVKAGSVVETEVTSKPTMASGGRFLEFATLNNLKTWRFAATVNDAFTVSFRYEMAGTETEEPTNDKVEVLPSLDVRITARPAKPTTNY